MMEHVHRDEPDSDYALIKSMLNAQTEQEHRKEANIGVDVQTDKGDEEAEALKQNWEFVSNLIEQLKSRGEANLSHKSREIIETMRRGMLEFASLKPVEETDKNMHDLEVDSKKRMKSTGAIPKTKQSFKHSKMEDSDGVTESSIPSMGPSKVNISKGKNLKRIELNSSVEIKSSSSEETPPKRKWRNKSSSLMRSDSSSDGSPSSKSLRKMLRNLDFHSVPQLETFNETSGQDLVKYLSKFEYYCQENFKGKRYLWINELERHLSGRVLEALQSLHQFGDNYDEVKSKLLIWYKDEWEIRKAKARKKFESARPKPKESFYIFSNRLETLYKIAYPKNRPESSNTLIQQFRASVSKKMRSVLSSQILSFKLKGRKFQWKEVQQCARLFDLERSMNKSDEGSSDEDKPKPKEIMINVGQKPAQREFNSDRGNLDLVQPGYSERSRVFKNTSRYPVPRPYKTQDFQPSNNFQHGNRSAVSHQSRLRFPNPNYQTNYEPKFQRSSFRQNRPRFAHQFQFRKTPPIESARTCHFCGKFGHLQANCRNRLGSCFGCGERGHFRRDCTNNGNRGGQVSGDSFRRWYSRSQSVSPRGSRNLGHERFCSVDARSSAQGRTVEMPSNHRPLALTGEC